MSLSRQNIVDMLKNNISILNMVLETYLKQKRRTDQRRFVRRFCVNPVNRKRRLQGFYNNLVGEMRLTDIETFANYHRMDPQSFDELLTLVGPLIQRMDIGERSITAGERLSLTLR